MIEPLASELSGYFYYYGARGAFLMQLDRKEEARTAFNQAIALAKSTAEAAHIRRHLDKLEQATL
jgi:RNA polymerase sigma-70 factor (ECF subfamily)